MFKCSVCGYIHHGEEAPERCPKCGAPKEKFVKLEEEAQNKIARSSLTNDLHMELKILLDNVREVAEVGIEDDLDPGCVAVFKNAYKAATEIGQMIKAELETHVKKEKWG